MYQENNYKLGMLMVRLDIEFSKSKNKEPFKYL